MLLGDEDLKQAITEGRLSLEPYDPTLVEPASIDVRLDQHFQIFDDHKHTHIDPSVQQEGLMRQVSVAWDEAFVLHPGQFALASTYEVVGLSLDLAAQLDGKSSLGRLGLLVHSTAGWIDPGFKGQITLELSNVAPLPIKLWPGMKVGQLVVMGMQSAVSVGYGDPRRSSRYQNQRGPQPSAAYRNFIKGDPSTF